MCGLFASIGLSPERERLRRVAHRGPDGEQWQVIDTPAGPLALGHRRLAIIDLSDQAIQPMTSADGDQVMIFNGEIYNYIELREELRALGAIFKTDSDCEVLLSALAYWGLSVLPRLRGMFAFLHYDRRNHILTAARDAYGIKPLSYRIMPEGIAFASEHKQIFDLGGTSAKLNVSQVYDYLHAQTTDHCAQSLFEGVMHLEPGHLAQLDLSKGVKTWDLKPVLWFDTPNIQRQVGDLQDSVGQFRRLFDQSIERHLRSDVPVGACLSGGLDSSYVVALASQKLLSKDPIHTFTATFPGEPIDERLYADAVNKAASAKGHFIEIRDEALKDSLENVIWHQDEPFGSTSIFAQYFVFEAIAKAGLKVVLDGQGADEQLAGYHGVFEFQNAALLKQGRFGALARHLVGLKRHHNIPISDFFKQVGAQFVKRIKAGAAVTSEQEVSPLASGLVADFRPETGSTLKDLVERRGLPELKTLGEFCLAMMMGGNLQMLLRYEDRNSMAHSVEARVPFLDSDLADFSLGLGDRFKLVGGTTKFIARKAMADVVPSLITNRHSKLGFAAPEARWIRGPLSSSIEKGLRSGSQRFPELLDWNAANGLFDRAKNETASPDPMLWRLANLGLWADRFDVST